MTHSDFSSRCFGAHFITQDCGVDKRFIFAAVAVLWLFFNMPVMADQWEDYLNLADSQATARNLDSARVLGALALQEVERICGPDDSLVAYVVCKIGSYQLYNYDYIAAESSFVRSLEITKRRCGEMHYDAARAYHYLGMLCDETGQTDRALAFEYKSLEICENIFGKSHFQVAKALHNLALTNMNKGLLETAESQYIRALNIFEDNLGQDDPQTAVCIRNLAVLYEKRGMYSEAERMHKKVLKIREEAFGREDFITASAILNLANCYKMTARFEDAEKYYLEAIDIWEKTVGPEDLYVAKGFSSLAGLYIFQKKYDEAEAMLLRALAINEKVLGPNHPLVSDNLKILGILLDRKGEFDEAEKYLLRALEINKNSFGPDHAYTLYITRQLGDLYLSCGKLQQADSLLNYGLKIAESNYKNNFMLLVNYYSVLSRLYAARHDSINAFEYALRETDMRFSVLHDDIITMSERDALAYSQYARMSLDGLLSRYFDGREWDPGTTGKALDLIQFTKGLITDGIFERQRSTMMRKDPETAQILDSLKLIKYKLSNLFTAGSDRNTPFYKQEIDSLENVIKDLEQTLSMRSADIRKWLNDKQLNLRRVIESLSDTDVFVDFYKFNYNNVLPDTSAPHYLVIIASKKQPAKIIDLGEAREIDNFIERYRDHMNHIAALGGVTIDSDMKEYAKISNCIYRKLWQPFEDCLEGAGMIMIAPDDALNLISFAGLSDDDGKYLIEKYTVHYLSSGRDLVRLEEPSSSGEGLFALGDPDFNATASERISTGTYPNNGGDESAPPVAGNVRSVCGMFDEIRLSPLPETRKEIKMIADTWKKYNDEPAEIYLGHAASEDYFKSYSPGNRVIHLATHGYFFDGGCHPDNAGNGSSSETPYVGENPLLLTGLFLAGANNRPESADSAGLEDGILTACEVSVLDLSGVSLVVLSACETGLGQIQGGEGVFGLRRAFQMAGARTVISTLWPVVDKSAMEIFSGLYRSSNMSLAGSVRQIQLDKINELRKQGRNDHPYNWGGVVIFGDWK